jgi:hypothetical protein
MPIKTFRGLLVDGDQQRISLHSNNGAIGYRIVKFEAFFEKPGLVEQESVLQIFKVEQAAPPVAATEVDFSNQTLIAAIFIAQHTSPAYASPGYDIIMDRDIFNQDIFITHTDQPVGTGESCNYYLELEEIKLDLNENTVATLKDIRNVTG